jgi:hypothetical protein
LATQAAALRPLVPGATWVYQGVYYGAPDLGTEYTNVITHAAAPRGVIETADNDFLFQQQSETALAIDKENVVLAGPVDFDEDGAVDAIDPIVLRSPVREGDQIVYFDKRTLTSSDPDGDGQKDSIDLAIYSQVVGSEPATLGGGLGDVTAVRVDTVTKVRMVLTSGAVWPTSTTKRSYWYAAGLGVVQRRLEPSSPAEFLIHADEVLTAVSGL